MLLKEINENLLTSHQQELLKNGHGRKVYECGHRSQCKCKAGHELPVQEIHGPCFNCKSISEITASPAVAGVTQNLFSGPVKRKKIVNAMPSLTIEDAKEAATKIKINWSNVKYTPQALLKGMRMEMKEHGNRQKRTDVIPNLRSGNDNPLYAAKIAMIHLEEDPLYYDKED